MSVVCWLRNEFCHQRHLLAVKNNFTFTAIHIQGCEYSKLMLYLTSIFRPATRGCCKLWNDITTNDDVTTNNVLSNYSIKLSVQMVVSTGPP